jgi:hypothetical protein
VLEADGAGVLDWDGAVVGVGVLDGDGGGVLDWEAAGVGVLDWDGAVVGVGEEEGLGPKTETSLMIASRASWEARVISTAPMLFNWQFPVNWLKERVLKILAGLYPVGGAT